MIPAASPRQPEADRQARLNGRRGSLCLREDKERYRRGIFMDVKEMVRDKARYKEIVAYFQEFNTLGAQELVLLIDTIELMSEEIFEHYKALQEILKKAVTEILMRRQREGSFGFLTDSQKCQLSYALRKAGNLKVLLWEKYEEYDMELQ